MKGWEAGVGRYSRDVGMVWDMYPWDKKEDRASFKAAVNKLSSQVMLAATRPDQCAAVRALKEAGFQRIATGRRTYGRGVVTLWGRKFKCKLKKPTNNATLNCCGIGYNDYRYGENSWALVIPYMQIFYVPKKLVTRKDLIKKDFQLFASTKIADLYVADTVKFFKSLEI